MDPPPVAEQFNNWGLHTIWSDDASTNRPTTTLLLLWIKLTMLNDAVPCTSRSEYTDDWILPPRHRSVGRRQTRDLSTSKQDLSE